MCGLVGVITGASTGFFSTDVDIFAQLLFVDVFRGDDATGVALVHKDTEVEVLKEAVSSDFFLRKSEVKLTLLTAAKATGKALLGHNRKSTVGKTNDENAHPFVIKDRYVFFHNGTLKDHKKIHDTEVDSEALGILLTETEGDPRKLEVALEKVNGAYACVWYDQEKNTIYFLRNKERPLHIAEFIGEQGIAYSSEAWMLAGVAARNNQKLKEVKVVKEDTLYSIDLDARPLVIQEETLTIKKSFPLPISSSTTGRGYGRGTSATDTKFSKKYAERLIAKEFSVGTMCSFNIDDYIETEMPNPAPKWVPRDWYVWGTSPEQDGVLFRAVIHKKTEQELLSMGDDDIFGTVKSAFYDQKDKNVCVFLTNILDRTTNETPFLN